jgi:glutamate N-acetyltransferase/amino-acid N-acetyltransferase
MLLALANGASGVEPSDEELDLAMHEVCTSLARQVARDGEGATKLIEVRVTGTDDPRQVALTIANSPLVKTAMFGCDPNWGRIIAAAGRSGVAFDPQKATLNVGSDGERHLLFEGGAPAAFDAKRASTSLRSEEVVIDLALGPGKTATVFTCDFGYGYVRINAEYHT